MAGGAVGVGKLGGAVTGDDNAGGPVQGNKGVRKIFGSGQGLGAAASDHNHSISFEHLPGTAQDAGLLLRQELRRVAANPLAARNTRACAAGLLFLMHLAFDDYEETGEERRAKEKADASYFWERERERYWHDAGGGEGMQPRRRFEREIHPDLTLGTGA